MAMKVAVHNGPFEMLIFSLMVQISFVKKFITSLLVNIKGPTEL